MADDRAPLGAGRLLVVDCGSTTTKAVLVDRGRLVARAEMPTTVEAPFEDVMIGFTNALRELGELTGEAVDALPCLATSSAGGGLQMLVAGVARGITTASAARAALGAGAIVTDSIAIDDGRPVHVRIERLRALRPDMVLLCGGVEAGTVGHVVRLAELIAAAAPRPRLGGGLRLPVVYAGNSAAVADVRAVLGDRVDLRVVANLRPTFDRENLAPARSEIHRLFLTHVMARAPGYDRLCARVDAPVTPTPAAVGQAVLEAARRLRRDTVAIDIGGATTDVFSVTAGRLHRTVSANLGMSYSLRNVLAAAGVERVRRWLPPSLSEAEVRDSAANKMVRPTSIPATPQDLAVEQAFCREALRLAYAHHRSLAPELPGTRRTHDIGAALASRTTAAPPSLGLLIASGGVLSHAPRRSQCALMLLDAFQPLGATWLAVDNRFLLPQIGALGAVDPAAARTLFEADCLTWLGTSLVPAGRRPVLRLRLGGRDVSLRPGELAVVPLAAGRRLRADVSGIGAVELRGGAVGVILDCRGRPLVPAPGDTERWLAALEAG